MRHSRQISKQRVPRVKQMIIRLAKGTLLLIGPKALWRMIRPGSLERMKAV